MATLPEQCGAGVAAERPAQACPVLLMQAQVRLVVGVDEDVPDRLKVVAAALDEPNMFCRNLFRVLAQP